MKQNNLLYLLPFWGTVIIDLMLMREFKDEKKRKIKKIYASSIIVCIISMIVVIHFMKLIFYSVNIVIENKFPVIIAFLISGYIMNLFNFMIIKKHNEYFVS